MRNTGSQQFSDTEPFSTEPSSNTEPSRNTEPSSNTEPFSNTEPIEHPEHDHYDVIIIGARAAGASTAMLLARGGLRVLAVDRSAYGSDTLSTHSLSKSGVLLLSRWGVLDRVKAAGTPVTRTIEFRYGGDPVRIDVSGEGDVDGLYSPRRTVLDVELVDEARRSGAEICHGVSVAGLSFDPTGRVNGVELNLGTSTRRIGARFVLGADGGRSRVAAAVGARTIVEDPSCSAFIFSYRTGLADDLIQNDYEVRGRAFGVIPTNDGLACVWVAMSPQRFRTEARGNLEGAFAAEVDSSEKMTELLRGTERVGGFRGAPGHPGFLRQAHGPGWALVGDAGYYKDPVSAHGITDAFVGAELLSSSLIDVINDGAPEQEALARFQMHRDALAATLMPPVAALARLDLDGPASAIAFRQLNEALKSEWQLLHSDAVAQPAAVC